ncbi:Dual specificity mitogen-activated protein kinase kinase 3 [Sparganum proliferum]
MSETPRPNSAKKRPPALKNFALGHRAPGIILPVEIAPGTKLTNETDVIVGEKQVTIRAEEMRLVSELGQGQFAYVQKMVHDPSGCVFAVKRLPFHSETPDRSRILNDYNISMRTSKCPYAIMSYGALSYVGEIWIVMELMDASLDKFLEKVYEKEEIIPERLLAYITFCVVTALEYLHKDLHVIHRDVKPSNILVDRLGRVKVCDFGISGELTNSLAKSNIGTHNYLAPERIDPLQGTQGFRIQSDVWSLGLTLLELATGEFPYGNFPNVFSQLQQVVKQDPPKLPSDSPYSEDLRSFIADCLVKDETKRANYVTLLESKFIRSVDVEKEAINMADFFVRILGTVTD